MKILMVVAKEDFKDEEFQVPYDYFIQNGYSVDVASTKKGNCFGVSGTVITADLSFEEVKANEYLGIVLVGGPGSRTLVGDRALEQLLHKMNDLNMVVAAICYSPVILARAGLLKNKKATVWNGDGKQKPLLVAEGARYVEESVVVYQKLITGNGPGAALEFAKEVIKIIEK